MNSKQYAFCDNNIQVRVATVIFGYSPRLRLVVSDIYFKITLDVRLTVSGCKSTPHLECWLRNIRANYEIY